MTSIHYAHYKDFVKCLQENPGIRFRDYCRQNGISYHGFYKWLQRNHISLKRLYKAYGATDTIELPIPSDKEPPFRELLFYTAAANAETVTIEEYANTRVLVVINGSSRDHGAFVTLKGVEVLKLLKF